MEKLNLPIIQESLPRARPLPMDHYFELVEFYRRQLLNRETYEYWKGRGRVDVPFTLR